MRNQFFYTRKEPIEGTDPLEFKEYKDSINVDMIIRSVRLNDDSLIVLLDDIHERTREVPNIDLKTNKVKGVKKETSVLQTEVYLQGEDIERFYKLTNVEKDE